jgi:ribonuclease HI
MKPMELKTTTYRLRFSLIEEEEVTFTIQNKHEKITVKYNKNNDDFSFDGQKELVQAIRENQLQMKKIIHSALKGKPTAGQSIDFAFIKDFPFIKNHDFNHYIIVDRRNTTLDIKVKKSETENIYKLITDGSYSHNKKQSAYAGIIEDEEGHPEVFHASSSVKSSNLIELLAITEGLKRLRHVEKIQVNTDSRFAIRGLTQWIHFWKLNDWHTAQGTRVKSAKYWQELDRLSEGKLLELKWIKARSGDSKHSFCHQMAKKIATASEI